MDKAELKLTKNELRTQQMKLAQLQRYLPTLQLKKTILQLEINLAYEALTSLKEELTVAEGKVEAFNPLLLEMGSLGLLIHTEIDRVEQRSENIVGVEIPVFEGVVFRDLEYFLIDTPVWTESAIGLVREMIIIREKARVIEKKYFALEKEWREVSIRVNLFEKILIPRSMQNIKKIRIFLGDQQLTAISQAKIAKLKISQK